MALLSNRRYEMPLLLALVAGDVLLPQAATAQQVIADNTTQTAAGIINTGTLGPTAGYGLYALNNGVIQSFSPLSVTVGGPSSSGVRAETGGQITIYAGSSVSAALGIGLYANGVGSSISATNTAISIGVTSNYAVYATGGAVINLSGGSVSPASGSNAVFAFLGGATINASGVAVNASGDNASGAQANLNGTVALTGGSVVTTGASGPGLYTIGTNAQLTANGTSVQTSGDSAIGAYALEGQMSLQNVTIVTSGASAYGARADNASLLTITGGSIATTGTNAYGVSGSGGSTTVLTNVAVSSAAGGGVTAQFGSQVTLNGGSVATTGAGGPGLFAVGQLAGVGAALIANGTTVTTSGVNAQGAAVRGGSSLTLANGASVVTSGAGAPALYASAYDVNPSTAAVIGSHLTSQQDVGIRTTGTTLNAVLTNSTVSGAMAALQTINGGTLNLTADSSTLTGAALTEAASGSITNVALRNHSLWSVTGDSAVSSLTNDASTIVFAAPTGDPALMSSFKTLTVTGNYVGAAGTIGLNTALGGDASPTDRLLVTGSTTGATSLRITNIGGAGAATTEGIRVVEIGGASNGSFNLLGDYVIAGQPAVVGGAYAYTLQKNGIANPADGNWYLRSSLAPVPPPIVPPVEPIEPPVMPPVVPPGTVTPPPAPQLPLYQPGDSSYEAYPQALQALNGLPTLQQRVGNRYWTGEGLIGRPGAADTSGSPSMSGRPSAFWGRIEGVRTSVDPKVSTASTSYTTNAVKLQAGLDLPLYEGDAGKLIGGLTLHYGNAMTDVSAVFGKGRINTDGYGFGGTLTWYGRNGVYVDAQAQASWYDSTLNSMLAARTLASGNNGTGAALSIETGWRLAWDANWAVTPQAQLIWSTVDFASFTDPFGARVSLDRANSLRGRIGVALDYEKAWRADDGTQRRTHLYAIANLYNEFGDGSRVDVSGVPFTTRGERVWTGLGVGGVYNWSGDRFAVYGEAAVGTAVASLGDNYAFKGTAGFRMKW